MQFVEVQDIEKMRKSIRAGVEMDRLINMD
jgi:hypothetical protein